MSYCDGCLHREVCGNEGVGDEALIFCKDRLGWIPVSKRLPEEKPKKYEIRSCYFCKYYEDEYCENLELKPCCPQYGCDDFSKRCNDYISRQAVLEYIEGSEAELGHDSENKLVRQYIKELPSVTPQPKKMGHWIKISPAGIYECSECGKNVLTSDIFSYTFCHGCGIKMQVGDKELNNTLCRFLP